MEKEKQPTERSQRIRKVMSDHVASRLQRAISRLEGKEGAAIKKGTQEAIDKYQLASILEKGRKAAGGIAVATHIAKGIHPDLKVKQVTNLNLDFSQLPVLDELGSHALNAQQSLSDTTGDGAYNSAAYELYLLLNCQFDGTALRTLLVEQDADASYAFAQREDGLESQGAQWACLLDSKCRNPSVHSRNKQIYWLGIPDSPQDNAAYENLVPLFPASLAHQAYLQIHGDRFGEANKAARQARRERKSHDGVYRDYPGLAVQKMGGTKPQNISQLNSERGGVNYLLASLPPVWKASDQRLPVYAESAFSRLFIARPEVRKTVRDLRKFLESDPEPNQDTRRRRQGYVDTLVDELVSLAGELQQVLPAGWTCEDERFKDLARAEQLWLDPFRAELPGEEEFAAEWMYMDWPAEVGKRFANWLNARLAGKLPLGDAEAREWKRVLLSDEDGFVQHLRELRKGKSGPRGGDE